MWANRKLLLLCINVGDQEIAILYDYDVETNLRYFPSKKKNLRYFYCVQIKLLCPLPILLVFLLKLRFLLYTWNMYPFTSKRRKQKYVKILSNMWIFVRGPGINIRNEFCLESKPTIGVEFATRTLHVLKSNQKHFF